MTQLTPKEWSAKTQEWLDAGANDENPVGPPPSGAVVVPNDLGSADVCAVRNLCGERGYAMARDGRAERWYLGGNTRPATSAEREHLFESWRSAGQEPDFEVDGWQEWLDAQKPQETPAKALPELQEFSLAELRQKLVEGASILIPVQGDRSFSARVLEALHLKLSLGSLSGRWALSVCPLDEWATRSKAGYIGGPAFRSSARRASL